MRVCVCACVCATSLLAPFPVYTTRSAWQRTVGLSNFQLIDLSRMPSFLKKGFSRLFCSFQYPHKRLCIVLVVVWNTFILYRAHLHAYGLLYIFLVLDDRWHPAIWQVHSPNRLVCAIIQVSGAMTIASYAQSRNVKFWHGLYSYEVYPYAACT